MSALRVDCPACGRPVALTMRGRLYKHGRPECALSRKHLARIWPAKYRGRRVRTVPGPDTWNPRQGAA